MRNCEAGIIRLGSGFSLSALTKQEDFVKNSEIPTKLAHICDQVVPLSWWGLWYVAEDHPFRCIRCKFR